MTDVTDWASATGLRRAGFGALHDEETSTHAPIGEGVLDFDALLPELDRAGLPTDWWCIDLCFWPDA